MGSSSTPIGTRAAQKEETREALVRAGMELFAAEGLDGPSLDAICARAGYTRGAFYVHFRDRDDLLVAVMDRVGAAYLDAVLGSAGATTLSLSEVVQRFVASVTDGSYPLLGDKARRDAVRVRPHQLFEACARSPRVRARYVALATETLSRLGELVAAGQRDGLVRTDLRARDIAALLLAAVIGAQTMLELDLPIDAPAAAATMLTAFAGAPNAAKRGLTRRGRR
jgi:AcrR family transcriptional regulator